MMDNAVEQASEPIKTPSKKKKAKARQVSTLNWMGTLILMGIPGVNLIAAILFLIFGKSPSKKHFAKAWILLLILLILVVVVLLMLMPDRATDFADTLREFAAPTPTPPVWA